MSVPVRFIIIGIVLAAAAYLLWPTWQYSQINDEREALAADTSAAGIAALARWDSLNGEDWADYRERRIKLGLDLRGGVYITVEVDIPELLYQNADQALVDETFEQVMAAVREEAANSDDPVIEIFEEKFNDIARPKGKTLLDYYDVGDLGNNADDDAILGKLSRNIDDAVDQAEEVIRQRVDKYGLTEPSIQVQGSRRIVVELPDEKDPARVRELLSRTARLEFKLVKNDADMIRVLRSIDAALASEAGYVPKTSGTTTDRTTENDSTNDSTNQPANRQDSVIPPPTGDTNRGPANDSTPVANTDTNKNRTDTSNPADSLTPEEQMAEFQQKYPFSSLFAFGTTIVEGYQSQPQDASGVFSIEDSQIPTTNYDIRMTRETMEQVQAILARPNIRGLIPANRVVAFSAYPIGTTTDGIEFFEMYFLKADAEMNGEVVVDAGSTIDQMNGEPVVTMAMNLQGAEQWGTVTGDNVGNRVAVVLDSSVYSAPWIRGQIDGGHTQISGSMDSKEADLLATILKSGSLKAPIRIIEERIVGPSLGADQIERGINAVLFAALLVILFMGIYYTFGGIVSDIAVMLNVFITLGLLAALQGTLTLPGIGAIVLTIGMAVDANILIYERIREELALGKSLRQAVQLGYEKAFSAIIDSNITTFITGVILWAFGSGPIQGFATMLMIGIVCTLFTAIFVTRSVFIFMLERDAKSINFGQPKTRTV